MRCHRDRCRFTRNPPYRYRPTQSTETMMIMTPVRKATSHRQSWCSP
jgi:hypothetical protein